MTETSGSQMFYAEVNLRRKRNALIFERSVFGASSEYLFECQCEAIDAWRELEYLRRSVTVPIAQVSK